MTASLQIRGAGASRAGGRHSLASDAVPGGLGDGLRRDAELAIERLGGRGRAEAGHTDEFAVIAEPARPLAFDRGFDTYPWDASQNRGLVLAGLPAKQLEAR